MPVIKQQMVFQGRGGGFLSSLENTYIEASVSRMKEAFDGPLSCEVSGRNSPISSVVMVPKVD